MKWLKAACFKRQYCQAVVKGSTGSTTMLINTQSVRALLWRDEVTGSTPGYVVLMTITNECEAIS